MRSGAFLLTVELLGALLRGRDLAIGVLVVNNAPLVLDILALLDKLGHLPHEVEGEEARLLRLAVVGSHQGLDRLGRLAEVVVGDLREQVVHDVGPNVVVHLVEDAVVPVGRAQTPPQVAPLGVTVPGELVVGVVEVGDEVEPHDKDNVGHNVALEEKSRAKLGAHPREQGHHGGEAAGRRLDHAALAVLEEGIGALLLLGEVPIVMGALQTPRGPVEEVKGVRQQVAQHAEADPVADAPEHVGRLLELVVVGLGGGVPRLVVLHVAMVAVVSPV
mmetsp:Transcript_23241/g.55893  ORF Transcript_23241/g.55893 Transcript_23241/m.55893 type:complete len:275 (-) Transcript_23241:603-1427(-)